VAGDEITPERLAVDYGLWAGSYVRGELSSMRVHAAAFLDDVKAGPDSPEAGVAHRAAGLTCLFEGEYNEARVHLERALALFRPGRDDDLAFRFGHDAGAGAMLHLAHTLWPLGEVNRAVWLVGGAQRRIAGVAHIGTQAAGKAYTGIFEVIRGDRSRAAPNAFELTRIADEYDLNLWRAYGMFLQGWAAAQNDTLAEGLAAMRCGVELLREQKVLQFDGLLKGVLADAEARAGDLDRAVAILDEALATCERTGHRAFEAEVHRARGEMLLRGDPANPATSEEALQAAIAVAKKQGTRSFELRAALTLAKLYHSTGRTVEAHAALATALEGFSPTPEMPQIAEAQSLLVVLAQSEEVKAEEEQRQRRVHLQTAYGQAMMWSKGFAAEETKVAFARAAEFAEGAHDFSARVAALGGQFVAACTEGELRSAREMALTFLQEAEEAGWVWEAAGANAGLGLIAYWNGNFPEARTRCERALDARGASPHPKFWRRSDDPSTSASSFLSLTMWQIGEVERSRELTEGAIKRAAEIGGIPVVLDALFYKSYLELWRGDPFTALSAAKALEAVAREHGAMQYLNEAGLHSGWARGRIDDPAAGAAEMRRVLTAFVDQRVKVNLGFYTGLLAQLEAETLGPESALARLDEAFRLSNAVEHGCSLPFLHRLRGEILLKRDPSDPASAEEAFRTSIAIAKEQGARSPVLLASLALAKLLQSTGHPAEAHAVLAPALEGFSPTPEMPEIAEAQALSESLA
jgi:predicted ATPase